MRCFVQLAAIRSAEISCGGWHAKHSGQIQPPHSQIPPGLSVTFGLLENVDWQLKHVTSMLVPVSRTSRSRTGAIRRIFSPCTITRYWKLSLLAAIGIGEPRLVKQLWIPVTPSIRPR
jgi:hypothetical protein